MDTLDDSIHAEVESLARQGDALLDKGDAKDAIRLYGRALELLPRPVTDWEAATWLFAAIGDAYWSIEDYERAYEAMQNALRSPGGIGNPFIHLRMGQLEYEFGNMKRAVDELMRAFMGADREIFQGQDPKYFELIAELI